MHRHGWFTFYGSHSFIRCHIADDAKRILALCAHVYPLLNGHHFLCAHWIYDIFPLYIVAIFIFVCFRFVIVSNNLQISDSGDQHSLYNALKYHSREKGKNVHTWLCTICQTVLFKSSPENNDSVFCVDLWHTHLFSCIFRSSIGLCSSSNYITECNLPSRIGLNSVS